MAGSIGVIQTLWTDYLEARGFQLSSQIPFRDPVPFMRSNQHQAYLRALRGNLPNAKLAASLATLGPLVEDLKRDFDHDSRKHSLPPGWVQESRLAFGSALDGKLDRRIFMDNDLLLCALIHPSFVPPGPARRSIAMPADITLLGTAALRFAKEVACCHQLPSSWIGPGFIASIPRRLNVQDLILFNRRAFISNKIGEQSDSEQPIAVPDEVLVGSATAICGAIGAVSGFQTVAKLIDILQKMPIGSPRSD